MRKMWLIGLMLATLLCCKKKSGGGENNGGGNNGNTDQPPVDPATAPTIGFFLDDWTAKTFTVPDYTETSKPTATIGASVTIDAASVVTKVPATVFGQNANLWMTQIV